MSMVHHDHGDKINEESFAMDASRVLALSSKSFEGAGDSSFVVIERTNNTRATFTPEQDTRTSITCLNDLHNAFAVTIMEMPSRLQIFEVIDEWMVHLERALNLRRNVDADIPDDVYQRLQMVLKKEYETWDLIKTLYFDRLSVKEEGEPEAFNQTIYDKFHLDERSYAQAIVRGDKSLQEMEAIIAWLELNYSRNPDPDVTEKYIVWEQTLETLKRDQLLGKSSVSSMVSKIDPDAVAREEKQLHPLDSEEELRVQRGTFHYLRCGNVEKAIAFLTESGHIAKAYSLLGSCMSQAESLNKDEPNEDDYVVVPARSIPSTSEYPSTSNLQPRSKPEFTVDGNPNRDLWKNIAWSICDSKGLSKWERAVIGVNCRHRDSMLDVAKTWEDKLWSYLKASVDVHIEEKLRSSCAVGNHMKLPPEYWSQGLSITQIFEKLESIEDSEFTVEYFFRLLQKCVMANSVEMFLENVQNNIEALFGGFEHSFILDHIVRFLTHVLLAFAVVGLPYSEDLTNLTSEAYIRVLVRSNQFVSIPFYVQKLSFEVQIPVIISQINCEKEYSSEEIDSFLKSASENELDVLGIGVAVVDKIRDEVANFDVDSLQWISLCYPFVEEHNQVMYEFLRYTVWISRKYLTLGDLERVKSLINQITSDCIGEVISLSEDLKETVVREFVCYKEYMEAEDSLNMWKKTVSQKPAMEEFPGSKGGSLADRALWEKKKQEFEALRSKWSKAADFHAATAITKFMGILKFPGGWLRNCCNPSDEDENIHINAVRRIIIKKVTYILLNLIKERHSAKNFREFVHVLCDSHRNIIGEFSAAEIGSIFKVVEEFTRVSCPNLMELPK